jgi:hypothetical protein
MRDFAFDGGCKGRDAALRRPRPTGRNDCGNHVIVPSPDAALGDVDSAARCPYPGLPSSKFTTNKAGNVTAAAFGGIYQPALFVPR